MTLASLVFSIILVPVLQFQEARTLSANESDQGLTAVEIEGHVGKMRILAGTSPGIRVQLEVRQSNSDGNRRYRGNPQNVDLRTSREGSRLVVRTSGDHQDLEETWIVEIPAHLQVTAELGVGEMDVRGVRGGLKAKVGVGGVRIDVPEGDIDAESGVGQVEVRSATNSYGNVDVRANVGSGRVSIDGREFQQPNRPPGPSERISLTGNGRDRLQVRSGVGNAELTIGR
jgi:hypothetical protein